MTHRKPNHNTHVSLPHAPTYCQHVESVHPQIFLGPAKNSPLLNASHYGRPSDTFHDRADKQERQSDQGERDQSHLRQVSKCHLSFILRGRCLGPSPLAVMAMERHLATRRGGPRSSIQFGAALSQPLIRRGEGDPAVTLDCARHRSKFSSGECDKRKRWRATARRVATRSSSSGGMTCGRPRPCPKRQAANGFAPILMSVSPGPLETLTPMVAPAAERGVSFVASRSARRRLSCTEYCVVSRQLRARSKDGFARAWTKLSAESLGPWRRCFGLRIRTRTLRRLPAQMCAPRAAGLQASLSRPPSSSRQSSSKSRDANEGVNK